MEIVTSVVSKIAELLVEPIGRQCGYLIYYKSNTNDLQEEADKLHDIWAGLQLSVQAAERNGEIIAPNVEKWLTKVGELEKELKKLLEEDIQQNKTCLHLKSYYSSSRKAKKKTEEVIKLQEDGKFDRISYPSPPPMIGPVFADVKGFESRVLIMNEVLKALKDDMVGKIGICGMGGVGKTTMVKKLIKIVEREKLFDEVVMAVVSQNPDFKTIQGELADGLGLKFDRETVSGRAGQLHQRLKSLKRVLIILDDVWSELDVEALGIPFRDDHNVCKILLVSRSKDVCNKMKCVKNFEIMVLSEEESWDLFKETAGDSIDHPDLLPIAKEVTKECGGLPIALVTVAKALGDQEKYAWEDALLQLQKSTLTSFSEINEYVFSRVELSYTYLRNEEIKSCFLLCCLFPEDFNIPVESLVRYGVGLRIFKGVDSLVEARNRVHSIIDKLKRSFLLLESRGKEHVKMHDVVRDAAISIASKQESAFVVRCDNQLKEFPIDGTCELCFAISLVFETIEGYPSAPKYQKLEFLQLVSRNHRQKIPHKLFEGMNELKVLSLQLLMIPSQPLSPEVLNKLRTLCLEDCYVSNVFVLGALENLEILSFAGSSMLSFPIEIGQLRHLRSLDLTDCFVRKFPSGVLSMLSRMEELYMRMRSPIRISADEKPILGELRSLSHLTTLDIDIRDPECIPKDLFFRNLIRFRISVNYQIDSPRIYLFHNRLAVKGDARDITKSFIFGLLKKTEALSLNLKNLKNVVHDLDQDRKGFPVLKKLSLESCSDLEFLIDVEDSALCTTFPFLESLSLSDLVNLKELWHLQLPGDSTLSKQTDLMAPFQKEALRLPSEYPQVICFGNLKFLDIHKCHMLKSVFSAPMGRSLVHLQNLFIYDCQEMEEIFPKGREDDITLSKLTYLTLFKLPKLTGFCKEIEDPLTKQRCSSNQVEQCNNLELGRNCQHDQFEARSPLQTRNHLLKFSGKVLFTPYWISRIPNIECLSVMNIRSLEAVFDLKGINVKEGKSIETFGQIEELVLAGLFELTHIWTQVPKGFQGFNKLRRLRVDDLHSLRYLFTPPIIEFLVELQVVEIKNCDAMENIVSREKEEEEEQTTLCNITFHKVCYVSLESLPALASFCSDAYTFEWPSLETLYIWGCHEMKTFGSTIQSPPKINNAKDGPSSTIKKVDDLNHHSLVPVQDSHGFSQWSFRCPCFGRTIKSNKGSTRRNMECMNQGEEKLESRGSMPQQALKEEATLTELTDSKTRNTNNSTEILPLFPSSLLDSLQRLRELELNSCHSMEVVFDLVGKNVVENQIVSTLNSLQRLTLAALPNLLHIWKVGSENMRRGFQNLKLLEISYCISLRSLIPVSVATLLIQLETIKITSCDVMEVVIAKGKKERKEQIMFPKINSIVLEGLPLTSFCSEACAIEFPFLMKMRVVSCPNLSTFAMANVTTPKLKEVETESVPYELMGDLNDTIQSIFLAQKDRPDGGTLTEEQIDGRNTINDDGSQKI